MGNSWVKQLVGNKKPLSKETRQCSNSSELEAPLLDKSISNKLQQFSFDDLKKATKNFSGNNLLLAERPTPNRYVFRGWIDENTYAPTEPWSGMLVAIKMLKRYTEDEEEWLEKVNYLGQLHHENLVKLIGYCLEGKNRLLVYEFMSYRSLENNLFTSGGHDRGEPIAWATRVNIAIGVARGIAFLHSLNTNVIFIDLRASTVLLDSDFNAKLSNFGLARDDHFGEPGHCMTFPTSHIGYSACEWGYTGRYTAKSEVYSFGVVLLELLTGIGPRTIVYDRSRKMLVEWAMPFLSGRGSVLRIMDARLGDQYSKKGAQVAAALALRCLNKNPESRPPIGDVLAALERLKKYK